MEYMLQECTLVAGTLNHDKFLFKNRDKKNFGQIKIVQEIIDGIEVVYAHDPTGWVEGMNEHGIGFVYSFLAKEDFSNDAYRMNWWVTVEPKTNINDRYLAKVNDFLKIILTKTIKEAVAVIEENKWNGNYFVSDGEEVYEIECFEGEVKVKRVIFKLDKEFKVKTNHGIMIPTAGHLKMSQNVARASTEIRKSQTETNLLGFKNYSDIMKRMGQQTMDSRSSLNVFRTDDYERTISQILLDLCGKIFNFVYYDDNSTFYGIDDRLPVDYKKKIQISIRDKEEFTSDDFLKFSEKAKDLYFPWRGLKHSKGKM